MTDVTSGLTIRMRADGAREVVAAIEKSAKAAADAAKKVAEMQEELDALNGKAPRTVNDVLKDIGRSGGSAADGIDKATRAATAFAASIGAAAAGRFLVQQADAYSRIQSQLEQISQGESARIDISKKVLEIAQETGSEFEGLAKVVSRVSLAVDGLGFSQDDVLKVSRLLGQSFQISGASASEAASSAQQFGQALQGGTLQGQELLSILENNGTLARAIAAGLGVGVGELLKMGENGELLTRKVFPALLTQTTAVNDMAGKILPRIEIGVTRLFNSAKNLTGALDSAIGASELIERALTAASEAADSIAELLRQNPTALRDAAIRTATGLVPGGSLPATAMIQYLNSRDAAEGADVQRALAQAAAKADAASRGRGFGAPGSLLRNSPLGRDRNAQSYTPEELAALADFEPSAGGGRTGGGSFRGSVADTEAEAFAELARSIAEARQEAAGFYAATLTPAEQLAKEIERAVALKDFFGDGAFERVMGGFAANAQALQDASDGTADAMARVRDFAAQAARQMEPLKQQFIDIQNLRASGRLSGGELQEAEAALQDHLARLDEAYGRKLTSFEIAALEASENISESLIDAIATGFTGGFDIARQVAAQALQQIALEQLRAQGGSLLREFVVGAIGAVTGLKLSLGSGADLSKAGASGPSGGPKAMGGPVQEGRTYLVGETGPELFTAPANGRITPSGETAAAGGKGVTIVNVKDPREALMAMQTSEGGAVLRNMVSTNREEFRRILGVV